jgi:hypothetical protein
MLDGASLAIEGNVDLARQHDVVALTEPGNPYALSFTSFIGDVEIRAVYCRGDGASAVAHTFDWICVRLLVRASQIEPLTSCTVIYFAYFAMITGAQ